MDLSTGGIIVLAGQKLLGKTLDEIGLDFANLYKKGKDQIITKATKKLKILMTETLQIYE